MGARLLPAADRTPAPWKNGGGVTTEVAVQPAGAGFGDFDWRVSMAQVDADGPFSLFPGVDRILVMLEGAVRLGVEGRKPVDLTPDSAPYAFAGDAPAAAAVLSRPALDLNVMVRRGRLAAEVSAVPPSSQAVVAHGPGLLIVTEGWVRLTGPDGAFELDRLDALAFDGPFEARLEPVAAARAYLVAFRAPE